jgi:hypothetical protein
MFEIPLSVDQTLDLIDRLSREVAPIRGDAKAA